LGQFIVGYLLISNPLLSQYVHPFDHFSTPKHSFSESKALDCEASNGPSLHEEQTIEIGIIPRLVSLNSAMQNSPSAFTWTAPSPSAEGSELVELKLSETNSQVQFKPLSILPKSEQPLSKSDEYSGMSSPIRQILSFCETFSKLDFNDSQSLTYPEESYQNFSFVSPYSLGSFFSFPNPLSLVHSSRSIESSQEQLLPSSVPVSPKTESDMSSDSSIKISNYPDFTGTKDSPMLLTYNVFEQSFENIPSSVDTIKHAPSENDSPYITYASGSRQRRLTTYVWEMRDFANYTKNNGDSNDNDFFELTNYNGDPLEIVLKPLSSGSVTVGTAENESATQGVALNMPVFPDSGIWTPSTRTYNDFMKITGTLPSSITINASAVKHYMNWHYGDWGISTISDNHYDLVYYSAVPEPSTYFMTGALFCLIGYNRVSRLAAKRICKHTLEKIFNKEVSKQSSEEVS
jgi:hypothetical protein